MVGWVKNVGRESSFDSPLANQSEELIRRGDHDKKKKTKRGVLEKLKATKSLGRLLPGKKNWGEKPTYAAESKKNDQMPAGKRRDGDKGWGQAEIVL